MLRKILMIWFGLLISVCANAELILDPMPMVNISDKASLQRGAKLYMNYCIGCHSLQYMRYSQMSEDLAIPPQLIHDNLMFNSIGIAETIRSAIPMADAKRWFGIVPPDLSLIATVRGDDWLYHFLTSFYYDPARPWGSNNLILRNTTMPNVVQPLRGIRILISKNGVSDHLQTIKRGNMAPIEFDLAMADLVNFLHYISQPEQLKREHLGILVILFLLLLLSLFMMLRKNLLRYTHSN